MNDADRSVPSVSPTADVPSAPPAPPAPSAPPATPRHSLLIPYAILTVALLITVAAAGYVSFTSAAKDRARFENAIERTQVAIERRIDTYVNLLMSGSALFASRDQVTRMQFKSFVDRLDLPHRYPGIQGIGVSARIPPGKMEEIIQRMRNEGVENFHVFPLEPPREEYHTIMYLEPLDRRNAAAIGYDMFSEPTRRAAMEAARDSGRAATSGIVTLVQEIDEHKQAGFLIYMPVYYFGGVPETVPARQVMLAGFVYAPFRADDLLRGIMGHERFTTGIEFDVYDGQTPSPDNLLHRYRPYDSGDVAAHQPQFAKTVTLDIPARQWTLVYRSTPAFEIASTRGYALLVLAGGGLTSVLLFALSAAQARAQRRAEHAADELRRSENRLRASESKFRRLADANLVGVAFARADGTVLDANDETCRILGRSREEVVSPAFRWHAVTPPESLEADRRAIAELRATGASAPYEKEFIRPDGTRVPVLLGVAQLEGSGDDDDCVALVVDLTTRKQAERELLSAKEAAEAARAHAEEASRLKDEFLATVSHELRTPLNAILGWSQLLTRTKRVAPEDLEHGLETIERSAKSQAQLIDDLLDVSRIVAGKLRLDMQVVQPVHAVEAAIESVRPAADAKGVRLVEMLDPDAGPVSCDPTRLQQIVWNLVANAVKFTSTGGLVQVSLKRCDAAHVQVSVTDTGIGISPEFLPYVFDRFRQADSSTTRLYGGLGLGLGIVRHLTELHGGTVTAHSPGTDAGATFTVTLPLAASPVRSGGGITDVTSAANSNGTSLAGVRVLLVEDDPDGRDLLARILADRGAQVTAAASVAEALEVFSSLRPDVVVSDITMPGEDGYGLIARIRSMPAECGGRVPAVALTALARPEDRTRALRAGFHLHVTKPVEPSELAAVLQHLAGDARDGRG